MDPTHFDRFAIVVGQRTTRRAAFGLLAALGLTGLRREEVLAVCAVNGTRCTTGATCCSGRCVRKRGTKKRFFRASPGQGICTTDTHACLGTSPDNCDQAGGTPACKCLVSRGGLPFCGNDAVYCHDFGSGAGCSSDAQCAGRPANSADPVGFPAGKPGDRSVRCDLNCGHTQNHGCVQQCGA